MTDPPARLLRFTSRIDRITDVLGAVVAWLLVPLVGAVVFEVVARYVFDAPTIWAYDVSYMLYGTVFMLGASYALQKGAHIRTDFFWEKWSIRTKGLIDAIAYVVFFFPGIALFFWVSANEGWYAYTIGERSEQTPWRPLLWPFKMVVPLTAALLLFQGVSELVKSVYAWRTGVELDHKGKLEV
jgi:TRAP-type mannitol/chloroaromatic compound transport system permease small subunit